MAKLPESKYKNYILVDLPGFEDTRSEIQDISNSICIKEALSKFKKIKIVLLIN